MSEPIPENGHCPKNKLDFRSEYFHLLKPRSTEQIGNAQSLAKNVIFFLMERAPLHIVLPHTDDIFRLCCLFGSQYSIFWNFFFCNISKCSV